MLFGAGRGPRRVLFGAGRGIRIVADPAVDSQRLLGLAEAELSPWFRRLAPACATFCDVGASNGWYGLLVRRLNPSARIIACEPEKRFHVEFQQNAALNDLDVNETFHWVPDLVGTSNVRLDDLLADSPDPVLLKIDVEGADVDVLKSGRAILDRGTTMAVLETHSAELENTCHATLAVLGYNITIIRPAPWRAIAPERRLLPHNRWLVALGPETPRTLAGRAGA